MRFWLKIISIPRIGFDDRPGRRAGLREYSVGEGHKGDCIDPTVIFGAIGFDPRNRVDPTSNLGRIDGGWHVGCNSWGKVVRGT